MSLETECEICQGEEYNIRHGTCSACGVKIYRDGLEKCCIETLRQTFHPDPAIGDIIICDTLRSGCGNAIVWDEGEFGPGWQVVK